MRGFEIGRRFLSVGLMVSLGSFVPLACGGSQEAVYNSPSRSSSPGVKEVPGHVVARLESCARQGADRLTLNSYAIFLDVDVTEDGDVRGVKVKDSTFGDDAGIKSCMVRALQSMSLPASVTGMPSLRRASNGVAAPESRALVGAVPLIAPLVGPLVSLGPTTIVIGGIFILVVVVVHAVSDATTSEPAEPMTRKERCAKVKDACVIKCEPYLDSGDPSGNPYHTCFRKCVEAEDCWGV